MLKQSLALFKETGNKFTMVSASLLLASIEQRRNNFAAAEELLNESLATSRSMGFRVGVASALCSLGDLALMKEQPEQALAYYRESLSLSNELGDKLGIANLMTGFGRLALQANNPAHAAQLLSSAETLYAAIGAVMPALERPRFDHDVSSARARFGNEAFVEACTSGKEMTADEVVTLALSYCSAHEHSEHANGNMACE